MYSVQLHASFYGLQRHIPQWACAWCFVFATSVWFHRGLGIQAWAYLPSNAGPISISYSVSSDPTESVAVSALTGLGIVSPSLPTCSSFPHLLQLSNQLLLQAEHVSLPHPPHSILVIDSGSELLQREEGMMGITWRWSTLNRLELPLIWGGGMVCVWVSSPNPISASSEIVSFVVF